MARPVANLDATADRRIPGWAAGIQARLARERPEVVTREDIVRYLSDAGSARSPDTTIDHLRRLGWLRPLHVRGAWAYLPPGHSAITDRYINLRAWRARDPDSRFALAGEAACWHLGYLDREFTGSIAVWLPGNRRLPFGLRAHFRELRLGWDADEADHLAPVAKLLHRRRLDLTQWATGIPAFGPEAILVQLAARVQSFRSWADLVPHLDQLARDCDLDRVAHLLGKQSTSAWQRAAYILHAGGRPDDGRALLQRRPEPTLTEASFGRGHPPVWIRDYHIVDRLIAPLQRMGGKA